MADGSATWIAKPSITNQAISICIFDRVSTLRAALEAAEDMREWVVQRCVKTWMSCSAAASLHVLRHPCIAMWSLHLFPWGSASRIVTPSFQCHEAPDCGKGLCCMLRRYIERPLLVSGRKFHIRAYVLCFGSLSVYAFSEALALFAGEPYKG